MLVAVHIVYASLGFMGRQVSERQTSPGLPQQIWVSNSTVSATLASDSSEDIEVIHGVDKIDSGVSS